MKCWISWEVTDKYCVHFRIDRSSQRIFLRFSIASMVCRWISTNEPLLTHLVCGLFDSLGRGGGVERNGVLDLIRLHLFEVAVIVLDLPERWLDYVAAPPENKRRRVFVADRGVSSKY